MSQVERYPAEDDTDFEDASRNLISKLIPCVISSTTNPQETVWDNDAYDFIEGECPDTANKSLWRQSKLCRIQGLFKIIDGIYQVRGLDLSNMTFVETESTNGVVIIDCLASYECAKKALELYQAERPGKVIKALIYTHCHGDHFGGADAVVEAALADLVIYAPDGFLEHAVSENVYAGKAMARRALYMYGESLPKSPTGQIGTGLGMAVSTGKFGLVAPTKGKGIITETGTNVKVDDLEIIFQVTPGTEAPSEMNFYFPQYRALCMAENLTHTMHNIQTLRGALVRDARMWARYLDEAIVMFGDSSDVVFSSHHWPTWGNEKIVTFMKQQRDLYAYLNNETLRLLNSGKTGLEIAEDFELPPTLNGLWNSRGYYGSVSHNVKAIYNRYMGWFDGNPAHLWEHPPVAASERYVKCMGGIENVIKLGTEYSDKGDLRFAATLLCHAVFADQSNEEARKALSTVYKQLGYGAENATWRNIYLTGAKELMGEIHLSMNDMSNDGMKALDIEQLMDTMAIRIDGSKAWDQAFTIDVMIVDMKIGWHMNLSNGVLTGHGVTFVENSSFVDQGESLTIWPTRMQFVELVAGLRKDIGEIVSVGNKKVWGTLTSLLTINDMGFAIVTPEKLKGH